MNTCFWSDLARSCNFIFFYPGAVRFILYESEMTLNIKYPWPFQYQCQFYNFIVTPQVITRSHVQDTIIFLKVYDLATEFIRSIDFEIIRSFRWKYSNIQLKSFENENSKNALEPTCDPQWSHVTFLRTRFNISRRMTPISLMAVLKNWPLRSRLKT